MKFNRFLFLAFAGLTFFASCESDDNDLPDPEPGEPGAYANGIFVMNEGNFGSGNSSVSFVDEEMTGITHNIFYEENEGKALGDTGQSMGVFEDYVVIVVNGSKKVEIVNRNTFEVLATIDEGLENPRYVAFHGGEAYVTDWGDGSDPNDDFIAVIDMENFILQETIEVAEGPEKIIADGRTLYVAHKGGYNFNNIISVINTSNYIVREVEVGDVPNSMEIENGSLWVASGGFPYYAEEETAGKIQQIDLNEFEVVQEFTFENPTDHPSNLQVENNMVYYTLGGEVYAFEEDADALPESSFLELTEVASLYGFNVQDGLIYASSASADNTGNGNLYIYDAATGNLMHSFVTGINPNGVYFN